MNPSRLVSAVRAMTEDSPALAAQAVTISFSFKMSTGSISA